MKIVAIEELNGRYADDGEFEKTDEEYASRLSGIKDDIERHAEERPIILLSGPSGSGKTTTAHMLEDMLDRDGVSTHTVSLDNYFRSVTDAERDTVDYEAPSRIDGELLSEHISRIFAGEEVDVPIFDFTKTSRSDKTVKLKRLPGELVIFEGIHALNPSVITAPKEITAKIYISVRTRISYGDGNILQPEYVRFMRRIARDKLFRGRDVAETAEYFASVRCGEENFVMPFKKLADYEIDSFIGYEPGVYKSVVEGDLLSVSATGESGAKAIARLKEFLKYVKPLNAEKTPYNSLIREFIGRR